MLALTRRTGQTLVIGGDIEVRVVRVEGDRVVLGVAAPRETRIVRGELLKDVSAEVSGAAGSARAVRAILGQSGRSATR